MKFPAAAALTFTLALALCSTAIAEERVVDLPKDEVQQLIAVFDLIKHEYVNTVDDKKLMTDAIAGMVASLDSHSQYLRKDDLQELDTNSTGNFVGIGVEVEIDGNDIRIISAIENSPADRAGIQSGDIIVGVDGTMITGIRPYDLAKHIVGSPNTPVTVVIARPGEKTARTMRLTREPLHEDSVKARMVAPGIAWVRITHFQAATPAELAEQLKEAGALGKVNGVVLDLRNNPGGIVSAAVGVSAAFLPEDSVVFTTHGRANGSEAVVSASSRYYRTSSAADPLAELPSWAKTVPMTVLVNGASASSAEIVAGALQDHKRAIVVGTPTFGKGSIQGVVRLSDSAGVKLTIARYYTPDGHPIQAAGIVPDIAVAPVINAKAALDFTPREIDLPRHLPGEAEAAANGNEAKRATAFLNSVEKTSTFGTARDKALNVAVASVGKIATAKN